MSALSVQAKQAELENVKVQIADAEAAVAEVKQSFSDDPLSLTGWMQALTDLADGGMTTFEVRGRQGRGRAGLVGRRRWVGRKGLVRAAHVKICVCSPGLLSTWIFVWLTARINKELVDRS